MKFLSNEEQHEVACYLICNFYLHNRSELYLNYFEKTTLLAQWLLPPEPKKRDIWPDISGADVCSSCRKIHGITKGARLRYGCYSCMNTSNAIAAYEVQELAIILQVSVPLMEYILAHQIVEILAAKERQLAASNPKAVKPQQYPAVAQLSSQVSANETAQ